MIEAINQIFVFLVSIIGLSLGIWVYLTDRKSRLNQSFLAIGVSIVIWVVLGFLANFSSSEFFSQLCLKLNLGAVALFFIATYFFSLYFPVKTKSYYSKLKIPIIVLWSLLFLFSVFTDWVIKGVKISEMGIVDKVYYGEAIVLFWVATIFFTFIVLYNILRKYVDLSNKEKLKAQYFLLGIILFASCNIIFNVVLPLLEDTSKFYFIGDYSAIFFLGFTVYAIVKRNLFGIKVVLTQILVGVIAVLLLINAVVADSLFGYIWKGGVFVAFLVSGALLIRSVLKEIEQREELEEAYEKLKKLDETKNQFLSIASHQLRTPLSSMKGHLSMVLSGNYGETKGKSKELLEKVYHSNQRLINLVNDLLNTSRLQMGKMKFDLRKTQIKDIIKEVVEDHKNKAEKKGIYLKFEDEGKEVREVKVDPSKIREVIFNLVDNAVKYTDEGGVKVKLQELDSKLRIVVEDTGIGMSEEEIESLFKIFERGDRAIKKLPTGVGMGLFAAQKIIEGHNGRIWAESKGKGEGSKFFIELPYAE